jgi:hypothetical protein
MNNESLIKFFNHPWLISVVSCIIGAVVGVYLGVHVEKGKAAQVTVSKSPTDIAREELKERKNKLVQFHALLAKMVDETNGADLSGDFSGLGPDAAEFLKLYDTEAHTEPPNLGADNEEMRAMLSLLESQLFAYRQRCGKGITPKDHEFCGNVAYYYVRPTLEMVSLQVQGRISELNR